MQHNEQQQQPTDHTHAPHHPRLWDGVPKDIMAKYPKICSFYDKFYALESVRTYYEK